MYTTSGSLNLLTPSSTTSRIRDFTSRLHERTSAVPSVRLQPSSTPNEHLKPPPRVTLDTASQRSRSHKKEQKKPSYLNLACSVNGYSNLTTYDSKLRQNINKSREASPIRPITRTFYRAENSSLVVPVPVSADKLIVPTFQPHDKHKDLTERAPAKAHTDPYLATSPILVYMAEENKQLKSDFLGKMSSTSQNYSSIHHSKTKDEVDNFTEVTFKSSYSENNITTKKISSTVNCKSERYTSESYSIKSNGVSNIEITKENGEALTSPMKSFIQQRVERLYGPGALAQGFFNQKRHKKTTESENGGVKVLTEKSINCLSGESHYSYTRTLTNDENSENECTSPNSPALPVLRHLRPEFRAQLPILSPKKSPGRSQVSPPSLNGAIPKFSTSPKAAEDSSRISVDKSTVIDKLTESVNIVKIDDKSDIKVNGKGVDDSGVKMNGSAPKLNGSEVKLNGSGVKLNGSDVKLNGSDVKLNGSDVNINGREAKLNEKLEVKTSDAEVNGVSTNGAVLNGASSEVHDAYYFLDLEKRETERLIQMAVTIENELEKLQGSDVTEEVLGLLRSAAGKARLLATQKMQQFEGLCYNNINRREDEQFPTTIEDLQGFWDMVCLQVRHVEQLFAQVTAIRENGWREVSPTPCASPAAPSPRARRAPPATPRNERARLAAEKREVDRRAMLEQRRRLIREKQLAAKACSPGTSRENQQEMAIEGTQEVELFVPSTPRSSKSAPLGDQPSSDDMPR